MTPRLRRTAMLLGLAASAVARADDAADVQRLLRSGDLPAALQRAEAAVKAPRADARVRFLHGVVLMELARDAQSLEVFTALSQDYPQLPEPYNNVAALHARAGRWEQARQALEVALRNDPTHALARENLGNVHLQLALQAWRAVRSNQPGTAVEPQLQRKIRLASELLAPPAPGSGG